MRFLTFIAFLVFSPFAVAGGCPPWQMCGKKGNSIVGDSSYSAQVSSAQAAAPAAGFVSSFDISSREQSADINTRITNAQSRARTASNTTARMFEAGDAAFRQQYLLRHPKPGFWGYDWGNPEK